MCSSDLLFQQGKTYFSRNPAPSLSSRSASFGSLSEKSTSALSSVELGFSCDSPEGGTIKKKPAIVSNVKKCTNQNELKRTPIQVKQKPHFNQEYIQLESFSILILTKSLVVLQKEVRFKDTFSTIPDISTNSFTLARQRSLPPPPPPPHSPPPSEEVSRTRY